MGDLRAEIERLTTHTLEICPSCGGSGFTGPETGYGGVCSECGGQKYHLVKPEVIERLRASVGDTMETAVEIARKQIAEAKCDTSTHCYNCEDLTRKDSCHSVALVIITAAVERGKQAERDALRRTLGNRLNDHLVEMREGYDDSIVGFNEAWDVMGGVFDNPLPKESERQAGVREGIEMAAQEAIDRLALNLNKAPYYDGWNDAIRVVAHAIRTLLPSAPKDE